MSLWKNLIEIKLIFRLIFIKIFTQYTNNDVLAFKEKLFSLLQTF